jgi:hypothetical protein
VRVRYGRDFRNDMEDLKDVLMVTLVIFASGTACPRE